MIAPPRMYAALLHVRCKCYINNQIIFYNQNKKSHNIFTLGPWVYAVNVILTIKSFFIIKIKNCITFLH